MLQTSVVRGADVPFESLGGGVRRRVLAYNKDIMTVEIEFDVGGVGSVHAHPHAQTSIVVSGKFTYTVGDRQVDVGPGDTLAFEPNQPHGTVCREAGTLIDVFSPMREDFVKSS